MVRLLTGIFVVLHGLIHLWYVVLSQGLVEFQADMGWTGESWLLSGLLGDSAVRSMAAPLYALATVGFVAGGVGMLGRHDWWRTIVVGAAALSTATVILFWDGHVSMIVQKGLIGLLIDVGLLIALLLVG
ncbi:MAG: hypothetical protein PVH50_12945 [Anaerolineae bacterium]|jgi:prepilin-type processing-associated H-X9-DG protein